MDLSVAGSRLASLVDVGSLTRRTIVLPESPRLHLPYVATPERDDDGGGGGHRRPATSAAGTRTRSTSRSSGPRLLLKTAGGRTALTPLQPRPPSVAERMLSPLTTAPAAGAASSSPAGAAAGLPPLRPPSRAAANAVTILNAVRGGIERPWLAEPDRFSDGGVTLAYLDEYKRLRGLQTAAATIQAWWRAVIVRRPFQLVWARMKRRRAAHWDAWKKVYVAAKFRRMSLVRRVWSPWVHSTECTRDVRSIVLRMADKIQFARGKFSPGTMRLVVHLVLSKRCTILPPAPRALQFAEIIRDLNITVVDEVDNEESMFIEDGDDGASEGGSMHRIVAVGGAGIGGVIGSGRAAPSKTFLTATLHGAAAAVGAGAAGAAAVGRSSSPSARGAGASTADVDGSTDTGAGTASPGVPSPHTRIRQVVHSHVPSKSFQQRPAPAGPSPGRGDDAPMLSPRGPPQLIPGIACIPVVKRQELRDIVTKGYIAAMEALEEEALAAIGASVEAASAAAGTPMSGGRFTPRAAAAAAGGSGAGGLGSRASSRGSTASGGRPSRPSSTASGVGATAAPQSLAAAAAAGAATGLAGSRSTLTAAPSAAALLPHSSSFAVALSRAGSIAAVVPAAKPPPTRTFSHAPSFATAIKAPEMDLTASTFKLHMRAVLEADALQRMSDDRSARLLTASSAQLTSVRSTKLSGRLKEMAHSSAHVLKALKSTTAVDASMAAFAAIESTEETTSGPVSFSKDPIQNLLRIVEFHLKRTWFKQLTELARQKAKRIAKARQLLQQSARFFFGGDNSWSQKMLVVVLRMWGRYAKYRKAILADRPPPTFEWDVRPLPQWDNFLSARLSEQRAKMLAEHMAHKNHVKRTWARWLAHHRYARRVSTVWAKVFNSIARRKLLSALYAWRANPLISKLRGKLCVKVMRLWSGWSRDMVRQRETAAKVRELCRLRLQRLAWTAIRHQYAIEQKRAAYQVGRLQGRTTMVAGAAAKGEALNAAMLQIVFATRTDDVAASLSMMINCWKRWKTYTRGRHAWRRARVAYMRVSAMHLKSVVFAAMKKAVHMARRSRGVRFDDVTANRNFRKETLMPVVASDWFKSLTIRTAPGVAEIADLEDFCASLCEDPAQQADLRLSATGMERYRAIIASEQNRRIRLKLARKSTPLHKAVIDNNLDAVQDLVIRRGADVNAPDESGATPLQLACSHYSLTFLPTIVLLLQCGARILVNDDAGENALTLCTNPITYAVLDAHVQRLVDGRLLPREQKLFALWSRSKYAGVSMRWLFAPVARCLTVQRASMRRPPPGATVGMQGSVASLLTDPALSMISGEALDDEAPVLVSDGAAVAGIVSDDIAAGGGGSGLHTTLIRETDTAAFKSLQQQNKQESVKRKHIMDFVQQHAQLVLANAKIREGIENLATLSSALGEAAADADGASPTRAPAATGRGRRGSISEDALAQYRDANEVALQRILQRDGAAIEALKDIMDIGPVAMTTTSPALSSPVALADASPAGAPHAVSRRLAGRRVSFQDDALLTNIDGGGSIAGFVGPDGTAGLPRDASPGVDAASGRQAPSRTVSPTNRSRSLRATPPLPAGGSAAAASPALGPGVPRSRSSIASVASDAAGDGRSLLSPAAGGVSASADPSGASAMPASAASSRRLLGTPSSSTVEAAPQQLASGGVGDVSRLGSGPVGIARSRGMTESLHTTDRSPSPTAAARATSSSSSVRSVSSSPTRSTFAGRTASTGGVDAAVVAAGIEASLLSTSRLHSARKLAQLSLNSLAMASAHNTEDSPVASSRSSGGRGAAERAFRIEGPATDAAKAAAAATNALLLQALRGRPAGKAGDVAAPADMSPLSLSSATSASAGAAFAAATVAVSAPVAAGMSRNQRRRLSATSMQEVMASHKLRKAAHITIHERRDPIADLFRRRLATASAQAVVWRAAIARRSDMMGHRIHGKRRSASLGAHPHDTSPVAPLPELPMPPNTSSRDMAIAALPRLHGWDLIRARLGFGYRVTSFVGMGGDSPSRRLVSMYTRELHSYSEDGTEEDDMDGPAPVTARPPPLRTAPPVLATVLESPQTGDSMSRSAPTSADSGRHGMAALSPGAVMPAHPLGTSLLKTVSSKLLHSARSASGKFVPSGSSALDASRSDASSSGGVDFAVIEVKMAPADMRTAMARAKVLLTQDGYAASRTHETSQAARAGTALLQTIEAMNARAGGVAPRSSKPSTAAAARGGAKDEDNEDAPESDSDTEVTKPLQILARSTGADSALRSLVQRLIAVHRPGRFPRLDEIPAATRERMADELDEIALLQAAAHKELTSLTNQIRNLTSRKAELGSGLADDGATSTPAAGKGGARKVVGKKAGAAASAGAGSRAAGDFLTAGYIAAVDAALQLVHQQRAKSKQLYADLESRKLELRGILFPGEAAAADASSVDTAAASGAASLRAPSMALGLRRASTGAPPITAVGGAGTS